MKKLFTHFSIPVLVKACTVVAAFCFSAAGYFFILNNNDEIIENEDLIRTDRPDLAHEQDVLRTMDPALGYVPSERLSAVFNMIKAQQSQKNSAPDPLSTATWVERGPSNIGGRTRALMFDPNDGTKKKVWAGGVGGGLWYTNDITVGSPTWVNVNSFWANIAVSCIAYAPSTPNTFYVGTGEGWFNSDAIRGNGIWKTTDGGASWNQLASTTSSTFYNVQKIVVESDGDVYAATFSGGVRRSTDGGTTWAQVLAGRCGDLEIGADGTLYASIGIFTTDGVYSSTNGTSWTKRNTGANGFPTTGFYRVELATAPSDANRVYALAHNSANSDLLNIYVSTDKGVTWTTAAFPVDADGGVSPGFTRGQAWYDLIAQVDPANADNVFIGGVDLFKTTNGGSSWTQISHWYGGFGFPNVHADQHAMVFQPGSSSVIVFGNDGGIYYTSNGGTAFANKNTGYNVTQFYSCAMHPTAATNQFLAGAQDNGTQRFTSAGMNSTVDKIGGDGAFCFIDQDNPTYQIGSYVYNNFYRSTNGGSSFSSITSDNNGGFINPADYDDVNNILYSGYNSNTLYRVTAITGTPSAGTISITAMTAAATHIKVSPNTPSTLFVGCSDGKVIKVTNADGSPSSSSISTGLPGGSVSCIDVGATDNDLLVTYSNFGVTSVWSSSNGGAAWTNREGNLPDMPVRWALRNPNDSKEVFLATEVGVWSTTDVTVASPVWTANNSGLANVRVDMLQIRSSDKEVIAATHGRGLFSTNVFAASSVTTTNLLPASCGITLSSLSQVLYCDYVSAATNYGYRVINTALSYTATYTKPNGNNAFQMDVVPGIQYAQTYSVDVRALVAGVWGNYGSVCTVTTPAVISTTQLQPASCGITLGTMSQVLYCDYVAGATNYAYRAINTASSYTATYTKPNANQAFQFDQIPGVQFAKTYTVQVAALVGGVWSSYGSVCTITTPGSLPTTQLQAAYCGVTLPTVSKTLFCDYVDGATNYGYLVTKAGFSQSYTKPNANQAFNLTQVPGILYANTYSVQVRAYVNGVWGSYGPVCTVATPATIPLTKLQNASCNVSTASIYTTLFSDWVDGVTNYGYRVTKAGFTGTFTKGNSNQAFTMTSVPGVLNANTYTVEVRAYVEGAWTAYGTGCTVTTPLSGLADPNIEDRFANPGDADLEPSLVVGPNPVFGNELSIFIEGIEESGDILVEVSNLMGQSVYQTRIGYSPGDMVTLPVGNEYSSGIYFISAVINDQKFYRKFQVKR